MSQRTGLAQGWNSFENTCIKTYGRGRGAPACRSCMWDLVWNMQKQRKSMGCLLKTKKSSLKYHGQYGCHISCLSVTSVLFSGTISEGTFFNDALDFKRFNSNSWQPSAHALQVLCSICSGCRLDSLLGQPRVRLLSYGRKTNHG